MSVKCFAFVLAGVVLLGCDDSGTDFAQVAAAFAPGDLEAMCTAWPEAVDTVGAELLEHWMASAAEQPSVQAAMPDGWVPVLLDYLNGHCL